MSRMRHYCADRTCGGDDCKTCFPGNRDTAECPQCGEESSLTEDGICEACTKANYEKEEQEMSDQPLTEPNARKNAQAIAIIETVEVVTRRLGKVREEVSRGHLATAHGCLLLAQDDIETALKALLEV